VRACWLRVTLSLHEVRRYGVGFGFRSAAATDRCRRSRIMIKEFVRKSAVAASTTVRLVLKINTSYPCIHARETSVHSR
jgi:hypothetical protein